MDTHPPHSSPDPRPTIREHLIAAAAELLGMYDARFTYASSYESQPDVAEGEFVIANIGYTGRAVRGSLVMFMSAAAAARLSEETTGDTSPEGLCDTAAELSNMLLGRLKNRLLAHGVVLALATPTTAIGTRVRVYSPAGEPVCWHRFGGDGCVIDVRNDMVIEPEFEMVTAPEGRPKGAVSEGDMVLF